MGFKARLYLGALFVVVTVLLGINAQSSCTTSSGYSYDTAGDLVTLYNIASSSACCSACQNFVESQHWTYGISAKTCVCKSQNSVTLTSNSAYASGNITRTAYAQPGVSCGSSVAGLDFGNPAMNVAQVPAASASACCGPCQATTGCNAWTYYNQVCYLKGTNSGAKNGTGVTSGTLNSPVATLRSGKRGLGWFNSNTCTDILTLTNLAWFYNWNDNPPANLVQCLMANGIEYIPMINGKTIPVVTSNIYVAPNSKHLLTFNEPNFAQESNLSPKVAAQQWPAVQAFAKQNNLLIGSPSAAAGGNPDPISWLDQFFGNCTGCQVDFINTHIYTSSAVGTTGFLSQFKKYNKPIWLTEFDNPMSGLVNATKYVTDVLPLLDADPAYERYAYFGLRVEPGNQAVGTENSIFNSSSNALTAIGVAYNTPPSGSTTAAPTSSPTTSKPLTTAAPTTAATTIPVTTKATTVPATTTPAPTVATTAAPTTTPVTTTKAATAAPTTTPAPTTTTTPAPTTAAATASPTTTKAATAASTTAAPSSPFPGKFIIKSVSNSKYVVVTNSTTNPFLNATALTASAASVLTATAITGGFSWWSPTYSRFVSADNAGTTPLVANRWSPDTWETFSLTQQSNGYYTITAAANNQFVEVLPSSGLLSDVVVSSSPPTSALFIITTSA